jgi:hypothetical protein
VSGSSGKKAASQGADHGKKPAYDVAGILKELSDLTSSLVFDLFKYLKLKFVDKTSELDLIL